MNRREGNKLHDDALSHKKIDVNIFCLVSRDIVPLQVCSLRKKELNTFAWNTCSGCTIGLMMHRTRL